MVLTRAMKKAGLVEPAFMKKSKKKSKSKSKSPVKVKSKSRSKKVAKRRKSPEYSRSLKKYKTRSLAKKYTYNKSWQNALKAWNKKHSPNAWCMPRKGSPAYNQIRKSM